MVSLRVLPSLLALGLGTGCSPDCSEPGVVCTVAGVAGISGHNGDGLKALETWLYFPTSITFSPEGDLVVADFNNMRVRQLQGDRLVTILGNGVHAYADIGAPALDTPLEHPIDIGFLPDGRLVVAEYHASRILVLEPDQTVGVIAGSGEWGHEGDGGPALEARLAEAAGLSVGPHGELHIADTQNNCIRRVDPVSGQIESVAGDGLVGFRDGSEARFFAPQRVLSTEDGVYVADTRNHAVRFIAHGSDQVETLVGAGLPGADGLGGPAVDARLNEPYGLAMSPAGTLLIADARNARVVELRTDATLGLVAGSGSPGPAQNGVQALDASFDFPADVAVDPADNSLYIADMQNGVIRRVSAPW